MKFGLALICCLFLAACSTALTVQGQKVKVIKSDPPANCKEIGVVVGSNNNGNPEYMNNDLRNNAAEKGANVVRLDTAYLTKISGTAFKCP
jgi:hypothetical protein